VTFIFRTQIILHLQNDNVSLCEPIYTQVLILCLFVRTGKIVLKNFYQLICIFYEPRFASKSFILHWW